MRCQWVSEKEHGVFAVMSGERAVRTGAVFT